MSLERSPERAPARIVVNSAIALIVIIWAVNFIAAKIGLRYLPAPMMAGSRVFLAGITMVPVYFLRSRLPAFGQTPRSRDGAFSGRDVWTFVYLGFFGVVVNQLCFTLGLRYTSVSHAAVIVGMGPVYALVLAVLWGMEKATAHKIVGMGIALVGVAVMASENGSSSHSSSLMGDAITMTGSLGFAIYVVLGKRVAAKYDALTMTMFNHFAGALIVSPLVLYESVRMGGWVQWKQVPWPAWAALLYMAVFSSAVAYALYFGLLQYLEASQLTAFTYLLPVLATILSILWLGERGSLLQVVGGACALFGVYWVEGGRTVGRLR